MRNGDLPDTYRNKIKDYKIDVFTCKYKFKEALKIQIYKNEGNRKLFDLKIYQ